MCTAVVQLFTTESPAHSAWIRRLNGIACFVRDSAKRSYSIRVYCLLKNDLVWEEEMYDSILINKPREFLISFEGKVCIPINVQFLFSIAIRQLYFHDVLSLLGFYGSPKLCINC